MLKKILLLLLAITLIAGTALVLENNEELLSTRVLIERLDDLTLTLSKEDGKGIKSMSLRVGDTGKLFLVGKNIAGKKIPVKIESSDIENIYFHQFNPNIQSADEFTYQAREAGLYDYTFTVTDGDKTLKKTVQFIIRPGLNLYGSSRANCDFIDTDSILVGNFCQAGIINGYADGTFRPEATINRAELMKIAYQLFGNKKEIDEVGANLILKNTYPFKDVEPGHWAAPFIAMAKNLGRIQGYEDGSFIPFQDVKRGEAWKMMIEAGISRDPMLQAAFDLGTTNQINEAWFSSYYHFGKKIGMKIQGENELADWQLMATAMTRLEVIEFMNKLIDFIPTETVLLESEKKKLNSDETIYIFYEIPEENEISAVENEPGTTYVLFPEVRLARTASINQKTADILQALDPVVKGKVLIMLEMENDVVSFIVKNAATPAQAAKWSEIIFNLIDDMGLDGIAIILNEDIDILNTTERTIINTFINTLFKTFESKGKLVMKREINSLERDIWSIGSEKNITELLPAMDEKPPTILSMQNDVTTEPQEEIIIRRRNPPKPAVLPTEPENPEPPTTPEPTSPEEDPETDPEPDPEPDPVTDPPPAPLPQPTLKLPIIIGFSTPNDLFNPGENVKSLIEAQLAKGITEVPIYAGGNVTPDGTALSLQGSNPPDMTNFMNLLNEIEAERQLPANTLRIRPYIRASVTTSDASAPANPNSPGKVELSNPTVRANLVTLVMNIASGQIYNVNGERIDEITLDFEDTTASNFDPADVDPGDNIIDSSVATIATFIQELKQSGFSKKVGLYSLGVLDQDWFPSELDDPGSPFAASPRNFISVADLENLFQKGLDVFEFAAYSIFPDINGAGGFAEQTIYGPLHADYMAFVRHHIQLIQGLGKNTTENLRILLPVYDDPRVISLVTALSTLQDLMSSQIILGINGGVFDFGSLDSTEKSMILNAIQ